ncbi:Penicillin-binding protein 2 (PBP-2) [uncultured Alphaproteobacteria bacterium]|uniref:Penicillin-binding protein 2 (PBP-2) n=1 Tax=uncultured Alphaproteobacteria bacterium TaxID=91750 RepID=A0A212K6R7_9PROT|nr:Penicillin-binding protein 2 (PBP-2) [uncultured Alphaproteobacteria bacterium]
MSGARDSERGKLFTRRTALLAGGQAALTLALAGRMYYLQVIEAERYGILADENRISLRLLPPPRGLIVDRFGREMAVNRQNFRVLVVREQTPDLGQTLDALGLVIPLTDNDKRRIRREVERKRAFMPVQVKENLTWEEMAQIQLNAPDLPGVVIDEGLTRFYPYGDGGAQVLGYVSSVSERDLTGEALLELPGFRIGKAGIEKTYDLALRGKGGNSKVEVNAYGRVIRELERKEGTPGVNLTLTLDLELQQFAVERIGEESAAAVVMDVHTGEVLVMASTPSFDPNAFNRGLSSEEWNALINNERAPLRNKCISAQFSPGSTFKLVVAMAALEAGVITPEQTVFCPGHVDLGSHRFHCWKKTGHGTVNMIEAIQHSCDVYFYEVARRVGIDRIADVARRFGLGDTLGVDLPNEVGGLIPDRAWKRAFNGQPWLPGETLNAGIGQGYVLTTPLQLAVMTARIANGGVAVRPRLTREQVSPAGIKAAAVDAVQSVGINPKSIGIVRRGMNEVVNNPAGTARRAAFDVNGQKMAGKTGTSQVRRITMKERETTGVIKNEALPWRERDHALFVAFAPVEAPRYACCVVVEHGGGGSAVAAPIASAILQETLRRDPSRQRPPSPTETQA